MWRENPLRRAVQAFSRPRQGQVPSPWWSAWQRCALWRAQWCVERRPVFPNGHTRAAASGLARSLGPEAGSKSRHGRHSLHQRAAANAMAAIVNENTEQALVETVV